jgi:pimeloyl-ACP methyl ester carboxylesterase
MKRFLSLFFCLLAIHATPRPPLLHPGLYLAPDGGRIYVGVESDGTTTYNDFYDPGNQRLGSLRDPNGYRLIAAVNEEPRVLAGANGPLGVSLYYSGSEPRTTIVLVHGNEAETREMGAIIPYFVSNGANVISYDQRGSGQSTGSFLANGPAQRAQDVVDIYDAFMRDPHVDRSKIGIYGFSNGGWTAPIAAERRPLAFVILGSAPAESIRDNADFEVTQNMKQHHIRASGISQVLDTWHAVEDALAGKSSWDRAKRAYDHAKTQMWFTASFLPVFIKSVPPTPDEIVALQRLLIFDPQSTLRKVRTPTLALYGELDRNVDVSDSTKRLAADFSKSGLRDFTVITYPNADHLLIVSKDGYIDDEPVPNRYVNGYPGVIIDWLRHHQLLKRESSLATRAAEPITCFYEGDCF